VLIDEHFTHDNISKSDFPEIVYSILSSYIFETEHSHVINSKNILCILKSFEKKSTFSKDPFQFIKGFEDTKGKVHHVATTRTMFWNPPNILMLSFKMYGHKNTIVVPEQLDLSPWIHPKAPSDIIKNYELFATSTHHGSPYSGHYVAYVKHKGQWYLKNDELCMKTTFPSKGYHYFVLYKRVNSSH